MGSLQKFLVVLAFAASAPVAPARASDAVLKDGGFESSPPAHWVFRFGGEGGGNGGAISAMPGIGAHEGRFAARLDAEPSARTDSRAWASVSQQFESAAGEKITASAWLCGQSDVAASNAVVQLRIEYFEDDKGEMPICDHMRMASDLALTNLPAGVWTKVGLSDAVPSGARSAQISFVLMATGPGGGRQRVWVDEVDLSIVRRTPPKKN
jgi:hypothetical protein